MTVRNADFAGSWYPAGSAACEQEIKSFLDQEQPTEDINEEYLGGIVPHAGWYYSGAIACNVIKALSTGTAPEVVVVFGMHLPVENTFQALHTRLYLITFQLRICRQMNF